VFYLEQEGRGAGLRRKAEAYAAAADSSIDTFSYYEREGIDIDPRDYSMVADVLGNLGITHVRLLTNNPGKVEALERVGIWVERIPLQVSTHPAAGAYMNAKRERGHLL
jgi:GTP cyclohydrolase II